MAHRVGSLPCERSLRPSHASPANGFAARQRLRAAAPCVVRGTAAAEPVRRVARYSQSSTSECEAAMRCETCGNDYDKAFQVTKGGVTHTFDSFECAIHALAPTCAHCG